MELCQSTEIPKEWEERGEMTGQTTSSRRILIAIWKKVQNGFSHGYGWDTDREEVEEDDMKAWEVLSGGQVVCSYKMALTRQQALNKIENEHRMGKSFASWSIRQSKYAICPACQCVKDEDGCGCNPVDA
jgi:hypothetical protein